MFIHEFAHTVHLTAMKSLEPDFQDRLQAIYQAAKDAGKFPGEYRMKNPAEFWADGVRLWFDPDKDKPHFDPALAALVAETFRNPTWRYELPQKRSNPGHLKGFDRSVWDKQKKVAPEAPAKPDEHEPLNSHANPEQPNATERLKQLKEFLDQGLITKEVYEQKKAEILKSL